MKKLLSLFACGLLLMACSKEEQPNPEIQTEAGSITFDISTGAKATKATLYGQEPSLHVTNVKVYAFKSNGTDFLYAKIYDITGWTDGLTFLRYAVASGNELPVGTYKFLAVGRNTTDLYTLPTPTVATKYEDMIASIATTGNEGDIYSGTSQIDITGAGTRVSIEMQRKVSGVLGYFKNVPQILDGKTVRFLRLSISSTNKAVNLGTGAGATAVATAYNIMDIDLQGQTVVGGVFTGNNLTAQGVVKVANSQLGGSYLIPVSGVTLTLGLYDAGGVAIKTWNVMNGASSTFSFTANNFYSLGQKMKPGSTNNGTPDPGDDDDPIDLLTDQTITITITPAWNVINNLTIQ